MSIGDPWPDDNVLLQHVHQELVRQRDHEAAEEVVDLLTSVAAAEELVAAVERGDGEAMAFHAGLVLQSLETNQHAEGDLL